MLKRLMGAEPSVIRVDFSPRAWSIFTWRTQDSLNAGHSQSETSLGRVSTCSSGPALAISFRVSLPKLDTSWAKRSLSILARFFFFSTSKLSICCL